MKRPILMALVIGALVWAQAAIAQGTSSQQTDRVIAQLESRVAQLDDKLARTPVPQARSDASVAIRRHQIREQRQRIQDLIEKVRSGQQIAPGDIDRALAP